MELLATEQRILILIVTLNELFIKTQIHLSLSFTLQLILFNQLLFISLLEVLIFYQKLTKSLNPELLTKVQKHLIVLTVEFPITEQKNLISILSITFHDLTSLKIRLKSVIINWLLQTSRLVLLIIVWQFPISLDLNHISRQTLFQKQFDQ